MREVLGDVRALPGISIEFISIYPGQSQSRVYNAMRSSLIGFFFYQHANLMFELINKSISS